MFSLLGRLRALFGRPKTRPRTQPAVRLGLEALDDRTVPAVFDVAVNIAGLVTPTMAGFNFSSSGPATTVAFNVFRSADPVYDAGDELVGGNLITTPEGGGTQIGFAGLTGELTLDPTRDYVLVVADAGATVEETNEGNNTAFFRKVALGAVVHGFTVAGVPGDWHAQMAAEMQAEGYDYVLPFVWIPLSQTPAPNATAIAGETLANFVRLAAPVLAPGPFDVVDVHLIGHSRGASVVSQTFQSLMLNPGPRSVQFGFFKETMLDPHVARNFGPLPAGLAEVAGATGTEAFSVVGQFSFDPSRQFSRDYSAAVLGFQSVAMDPPAFVPAAVDQAEVFFQRLPWNQTTWVIPGLSQSIEQFIGVNLITPGPVSNPFLRPVQYIDLGPQGVGHYEVPDWYRLNVVPTLGG
jgi:hypothetical protein